MSHGRIFAAVAGLFLLSYGALLAANISFAVGGSDSSSYASTAKLLAEGRIVTDVEPLDRFGLRDASIHLFLPLGFVPGPEPRTMAPFYPMGMPLHMAAFGLIFGWEVGPFFVSPLAAVGCLVLMFLLARELGLSRWLSLAAAAILGACAVFLFQALQPMSDVPTTFWCAAAILAALYARRQSAWAAAAGAAFGIAVLIRPTTAVLLPALLFALPIRVRHGLLFAAGGAPIAAMFFLYNNAAYGNPLITGYGTFLLDAFAWRHFPARFLHYGEWLLRMLSPLLPIGFVVLLFLRRVQVRIRALLFCWFAGFFLLYCFYEPYNTWWFTRFLLPGLPAMIVGALLAVRETISSTAVPLLLGRMTVTVLVGTALVVAVRQTVALSVTTIDQGQAFIPDACRWAQAKLSPRALVLSVEMSGALMYYTNLTPVRWDAFRPELMNRLLLRTEERGTDWFALLMPHEVQGAQKQMPGEWTLVGERGQVRLWYVRPAGPGDSRR